MSSEDQSEEASQQDAGDKQDDTVMLTVKDHGTNEKTVFKCKRVTKLGKIFKAYAVKKGVNVDVLRFYLDEGRLNAEQTAGVLDLDEEAVIDVHVEQHGGSST